MSGSEASATLRAVVSGENAAVWAYGVIGAFLAGREGRQAHRILDEHRAARQRWAAAIQDPPAAAVEYDLPEVVRNAGDARNLAILVERRLVAVYADAAAQNAGSIRAAAVADAVRCASRAVQWGGDPTTFGT